MSTLNYAALTGDVTELKRLSADECTACANYIDLYAKTYREGGKFTEGEWTFVQSEVRYTASDKPAYVTVTVRISPGTQQPDAEAPVAETTAKKSVLTFELGTDVPRRVVEITRGGFE